MTQWCVWQGNLPNSADFMRLVVSSLELGNAVYILECLEVDMGNIKTERAMIIADNRLLIRPH